MVGSRTIARTVRMLARHLTHETLVVVLVSESTRVITLIRFTDNPRFRRQLDEALRSSAVAVGLLALRSGAVSGPEMRFPFPWSKDRRLNNRIFDRIDKEASPDPAGICASREGIGWLAFQVV